MTIGWPQFLYLALTVLGLGLELAKHGEPETGQHHFGYSLLATVVVVALLWWGGFFK